MAWFERIMPSEWRIGYGAVDHLNENIVPFFEKHPLKSKKRVDFAKFRKIVQLMMKGRAFGDRGHREDPSHRIDDEHRM